MSRLYHGSAENTGGGDSGQRWDKQVKYYLYITEYFINY